MEKTKLKKCLTCVLAVVFVMFTCVLSYSDADNISASGSQSRKYRMYTRANREITTYTLEQLDGVYTRSIIGTDDRYISYNQNYTSGCVKVGSGNGFIVGKNLILTNAHVVANSESKYIYSGDGYYKTIGKHSDDSPYSVTLYNKNGTEYGSFDIESVHVPDKYFADANPALSNGEVILDYDYALVTLSGGENIDWSKFHCFELGTVLDGIENINGSSKPIVNLVAYNYLSKDDKKITCLLTQGYIISMNNYAINYDVNIAGGDSGSLLVVSHSYNGERYDTVVAINKSSGAWGVRITSPILKFYLDNSNV